MANVYSNNPKKWKLRTLWVNILTRCLIRSMKLTTNFCVYFVEQTKTQKNESFRGLPWQLFYLYRRFYQFKNYAKQFIFVDVLIFLNLFEDSLLPRSNNFVGLLWKTNYTQIFTSGKAKLAETFVEWHIDGATNKNLYDFRKNKPPNDTC